MISTIVAILLHAGLTETEGKIHLAVKTGETGVAPRYASALFELADETGQLDKVARDLRAINNAITDVQDLQRLVRSPVISRREAGAAMGAVLENAKVSALTCNFVGLVASNRRLFALQAMIRAYLDKLSSRRGEVSAEVTSAIKLTKKQIDSIASELKAAVGAKVSVDVQIDPSLIGGLIVKVGSRMIDSSIKTKLSKLKLALKGAA